MGETEAIKEIKRGNYEQFGQYLQNLDEINTFPEKHNLPKPT